jgi:hypothetical protein
MEWRSACVVVPKRPAILGLLLLLALVLVGWPEIAVRPIESQVMIKEEHSVDQSVDTDEELVDPILGKEDALVEGTSTSTAVPSTSPTAPVSTEPETTHQDEDTDDKDSSHSNPALSVCQLSQLSHASYRGALDIWYPCAGPSYDEFSMRNLTSYAQQRSLHGEFWGRRGGRLPAHTHMLLWGNSHLRQVAHAMACQQATQNATWVVRLSKVDGNTIHRVDFDNNASLTIVANSVLAFSKTWQADTAVALGRPLEAFSIVALGQVDTCEGSSAWALEMQAATQGDCLTYPSIRDWTTSFAGPIVLVSAFSHNRRNDVRAMVQDLTAVAAATNRTNLAFSYGRRHIQAMGRECAAGRKKDVADCREEGSGQRCTGAHGGHADMVAWDVLEFMHGHVGHGTDRLPTLPKAHVPPLWTQETLQYCQSPTITIPQDWLSDQVEIAYQCEGPKYASFATDLMAYSDNTTFHGPFWGRRPFPIPAHKRVLLFGNSHTRQVAETLACQQMASRRLQDVVDLDSYGAIVYTFANNSTLVSVTNSFIPYSHKWARLLESEIGSPIESYDALVLGFFNKCGGDNVFSRVVEEVSQQKKEVDCLNIAPPTLSQVAKRYDGPIVFVSMFDDSRDEDYATVLGEATRLQATRSTLTLIPARRHDAAMQTECLSPKRFSVNDCADAEYEVETSELLLRHACCGIHGGVSDLVAWDVTEYLHDQLG